MGKDTELGPIASYNSLHDPNLRIYFNKSIVRHHLRQAGLINRRGEVIPDEVWRKRLVVREKMENASHVIAHKVVQQAIELKKLEHHETVKRLEEETKRELVRRIRHQTAGQNRQLPLLWPERHSSHDRHGPKRSGSRSSSPKHYDDDDSNYDSEFKRDRRRRPNEMSERKRRSRSRRNQSNVKRAQSAYVRRPVPVDPPQQPCTLTVYYYGRGVNLKFDTQVFNPRDQIDIYQQHCGGENVLVYSGMHEPGEKFKFVSKRHKEYPFSLTIFINGSYDSRISTCCEFKHHKNVRIGGRTGRFAFTDVTGAHPCIKCLLEKDAQAKRKEEERNQKKKGQTSSDDDENKPRTQIPIKDSEQAGDHENDYEDDYETDEFSKSSGSKHGDNDWLVKVYTSETRGQMMDDNDAKIYMTIFDEKSESNKMYLNKNQLANKSNKPDDLFGPGDVNEFMVRPSIQIGKVTKIKIGHQNDDDVAWHLKKIELTNKKKGLSYVFDANRWLAVDQADGKTEVILFPVGSQSNGKDSRLEVEVVHDVESDTDASALRSASSKNSSNNKNKRLHKNDVINTIKNKEDNRQPASSRTNSSINTNRDGNKKSQASSVTTDTSRSRTSYASSANKSSVKPKTLKPVQKPLVSKSRNSSSSSSSRERKDDKKSTKSGTSTTISSIKSKPATPQSEWIVKVYTSEKKGVSGEGTDSNVFIVLMDGTHETEKIWLNRSSLRDKSGNLFTNLFESGQIDEFEIAVQSQNLSQKLEKIKIGHDNSGLLPSWHLNKVELFNKKNPQTVMTFECNKWLSKKEDDGQIERVLSLKDGRKDLPAISPSPSAASKKKASAVDVKKAISDSSSSDENLSKLFNPKSTGRTESKSSIRSSNKDQSDKRSSSKQSNQDKSEGFNLKNLEKRADSRQTNKTTESSFPVTKRPGSSNSSSSQSSRSSKPPTSPKVELTPKTKSPEPAEDPKEYDIILKTGSKMNESAKSSIVLTIFGDKRKVSDILLEPRSQDKRFDPDSVERYDLTLKDAGKIEKIVIEYKGTSECHLEYIKIVHKNEIYLFELDKSFDSTHKRIEAEATAFMNHLHKYEIEVKTNLESEAEFDSQTLYLSMFGATNNLLEFPVDKESSLNGNRRLFVAGNLDKFDFFNKDIGKIRKITLRHESDMAWSLSFIKIKHGQDVYTFTADTYVNRHTPIDLVPDGSDSDSLRQKVKSPTNSDTSKKKYQDLLTNYEIQVKASEEFNSRGSDDLAVKVNLHGTNVFLADIELKDSETNSKPFRKNQLDRFLLPEMRDVGNLSKIMVEIENKEGKISMSDCKLEFIKVIYDRNVYTFIPKTWTQEDEHTVRAELEPSSSQYSMYKYEIEIQTSNEMGAGTDAKVHMLVIGDEDEQVFELNKTCSITTNSDLFEKGKLDKFLIYDNDIGEITKIKLKHNNEGMAASWKIDFIKIKAEKILYIFTVNKWIDKDGIELTPDE